MSTVRFTTDEFRSAATRSGMIVTEGVSDGEVVFYVTTPGNEVGRLVVRSSIDVRTGVAADTGDNSIRIWNEAYCPRGDDKGYKWRPLGQKLDAWTTRESGWESRMLAKVAEISKRIVKADNFHCPTCKSVKWVGISSSEKNPGRPYAQCREHNWFAWLDVGDGKLKASKPAAAASLSDVLGAVENQPTTNLEEVEPDEPMGALALVKAVKPTFVGEPDAEQAAFINAPAGRSYIVNAGAGSGKTFSAVRRVKTLVERDGIPLNRILFVTFGKTAALEIQERLARVLPGDASVSTIHAHCYRAMKARGDKRSVVKYWDMRKLSDALADEIWRDARERPSFGELMSVVETAKFMGYASGEDAAYFDSFGPYKWELMDFRKRFDAQMRASRWCTFADMMFEYERALRDDPAYLESERGRFDHVIVDEAQDTGRQAMRILMALAGGDIYGTGAYDASGITLVGDPDQLLYRWAGAWPESMMGAAEEFFSVERFNIGTNYRSVASVVEKSAQVIANNYEPNGPCDARLLKSIRPNRDEEGLITIAAREGPIDEALWVCEQMQSDGIKPEDVFVVSRTRAQLAYVEAAMSANGIPCVNLTGGSFWDLSHVKKAVCYLRLALDPSNKAAWEAVYNVPSSRMENRRGEKLTTRYLGAQFLQVCPTYEECARRWRNLDSALYRWTDGITDVTTMVEDIQAKTTISAKMAYIVEQMKDWIRNRDGDGDEGNSRFDDLDIVADTASKQGENFLPYVDSCLEAAARVKNRDWNGVAVLSTIHRLKGLERPTVFVIGCGEGLKYNKVTGVEEPRGLLPHTFSLMPPPQNGVLALSGQSSIEDERCLFYVACTRARDRLYLSYPREYNGAVLGPSRFILEMEA